MTGRGTANLLTRATMALAAAFFVTSIGLTLLARHGNTRVSPLDSPAASKSATPSKNGETKAPGGGGVLDSLEKGKQRLPALPKSE
jgi:preprotein translocase subunit SecG